MKLRSVMLVSVFLLALAPVGSAQSGEIRLGEKVRGHLSKEDKLLDDGSYYRLYEFRAQRGQNLTIELRSTGFDPYLTLIDEWGTEIMSTHDVSENHVAKIEITAIYPGKYLLRINSVRKTETGSFTLLVK